MRAGRFVRRRDTHQAFNGQAVFAAAKIDEGVGLRRRDPGLLRLLSGVDLDQKPRAGAPSLHGIGKRARKPGPVHGFDNIEKAEGVSRLVGLQRADQPQFEPRAVRSLPIGRPARDGFLDTIFAEHRLPGGEDRLYRRPWLLLGHRREAYLGRIAPGGARGVGHEVENLAQRGRVIEGWGGH